MTYTIEELAGLAGLPLRTLRYYIAEGLVPGPERRGKGARYGPEHLSRLLLVRRLTSQRVPLAQIRDRLAGASPRELARLKPERQSPRAFLEELLTRARSQSAPVPTPQNWSRYALADGLELSLRADLQARYLPLLQRVAGWLAETGDA